MKTNHKNKRFTFIFIISSLLILAFITGCQPEIQEPIIQATEPETSIATEEPVEPIENPQNSEPQISLDFSGLSSGFAHETISAVQPNDESPYWEIMPEYRMFTLNGYPITNHLMKPQIFIYPVSELASYNPGAAQIADDLRSLIENQNVGELMPFLPMYNAAQVMHAQVKFIDFQNGRGVRFLTQFDQAPIPLNNYELIYTFQGITVDGLYYVAAVFPVTQADLPADDKVSFDEKYTVDQFVVDMAASIEILETQPISSFTPDLSVLDKLIQSLGIN